MRTRILPAVLLVMFTITSHPSTLSAGWSLDGGPVCLAGGVQSNPQIVSDGVGGAFIIWDDSRTLTDIYAQRVDELGRPYWAENGIAVCSEYMWQARVKAVSDGAGGFIVVWEDSREESHWDLYAQRVDADGNILWPAGGVAVCAAAGDQRYPEICGDGMNGCIVTWVDERLSEEDDDIYAQRIGAGGTALWTVDGVVVSAADSLQQEAMIVSDGSNGAVIVWADYRDALRHVYAQRIDPDGAALWTAGGDPVVNIPGENHYQHDICTDGAGGAFVAWCDRQGTSLDTYVQRMDSAGDRDFADTGLLLCNATGTQREPEIAYDGFGGAIIAWVDFRNGFDDSDIYSMRVGGNGAKLWDETNGEAVCNSADQVYNLEVISDMYGGGIFAWSDLRDFATSAYDVYAQRLDADAQPVWTIDGEAICRAAGSQDEIVMASDGDYGAILAWTDPRNPDDDIYAQRITYSGGFVATELSSFSCTPDGGVISLEWSVCERRVPSDFIVTRRESASSRCTDLAGEPVTFDGHGFTYDDLSAEAGVEYLYRVDIADGGERRELFETAAVSIPAAPLLLLQNVPNPFNPSTVIRWHLDERSDVRLEVFDPAGRKIATLAEGTLEAGDHSAGWDGTDGDGRRAASGVYLYRLTAGKRALTRKMVLLR